jgi:hypothetical protein
MIFSSMFSNQYGHHLLYFIAKDWGKDIGKYYAIIYRKNINRSFFVIKNNKKNSYPYMDKAYDFHVGRPVFEYN